MHRNERREARTLKRDGVLGRVASGNHLAAMNDEPEPVLAGSATQEEQALARMFGGDREDGLVIDARERGTRAGSTR